MKILVNNIETEVPDNCNVSTCLEQCAIPFDGTAVAVNNSLVRHSNWSTHILKNGDSLTVISAAYGG